MNHPNVNVQSYSEGDENGIPLYGSDGLFQGLQGSRQDVVVPQFNIHMAVQMPSNTPAPGSWQTQLNSNHTAMMADQAPTVAMQGQPQPQPQHMNWQAHTLSNQPAPIVGHGVDATEAAINQFNQTKQSLRYYVSDFITPILVDAQSDVINIHAQAELIKNQQDQQQGRLGRPVNFAEETKTEIIVESLQALVKGHNKWLAVGKGLENVANDNLRLVERDFGVLVSLLVKKDDEHERLRAENARLRAEIARRDRRHARSSRNQRTRTDENSGATLQSQENSTPAHLVPGNSSIGSNTIDPRLLQSQADT